MQRILAMLCLLGLLAGSALALWQAAPAKSQAPSAPATEQKPAEAAKPPAPPPTVTRILSRQLALLETQFISAAEAMPEDKYDFRPSGTAALDKTRTFRDQVMHVAANNFLFAATLLGEPSPVKAEERETGPANIRSKADVLKYVKESFAAAQKSLATVNDGNSTEVVKFAIGEGRVPRLFVANIFAWHGFDHYGQMALYLRMNNIVPPGSQEAR